MIVKNDRFSAISTNSKAQEKAQEAKESSKSSEEELPPPAYEAVEDFQFIRPQFGSAHSAPETGRARTISSTSQSTQLSTVFDNISYASSSVSIPTITTTYTDSSPSHRHHPSQSHGPSPLGLSSSTTAPSFPEPSLPSTPSVSTPSHVSTDTNVTSSSSTTTITQQPVFTPKKRTLGFVGPTLSKQAREWIIGHVNDLLRQTHRYTLEDCRTVLRGCEEACRVVNGEEGKGKSTFSLSDVLQEKSIDEHTPFYWAVIHRPATHTHRATDDRVPVLLSALLDSVSLSLTESTKADIRHACLMLNDQDLFQDIRVRYSRMATVSLDGYEDDKRGFVDTVVVQEIPGSEPVFCVDFEIEGFLERMMGIGNTIKTTTKGKNKEDEQKGIEVEFIAHRRAWMLELQPSSQKSSKSQVPDPWTLSISLLEFSTPTYLDSEFRVSEWTPVVPPKDGTGSGRGHLGLGLGLTPSPSMPNLKLDHGTTGTNMGTTTMGRAAARGGNTNTNTLFLADTSSPNHHPHDLSTRLKSSSMIQPPGKNGKLNREIVVLLDDDGKGKGKEVEGRGIGHALRMKSSPYLSPSGALRARLDARLAKPASDSCIIC